MKKSDASIKQFDISPLAKAGVFVINIKDGTFKDGHNVFDPHKDNHYILMIGTKGSLKIMLDFTDLLITSPAIMLIAPGQVHHILEAKHPEGWSISFEPSLINDELEQVLDGFTKPFSLLKQDDLSEQLVTIAAFIAGLQNGVQNAFTGRTSHDLLRAILGLITGKISQLKSGHKTKESRASEIEQAFNRLLKDNYKTWKQPALYANALSISTAHLNDTIKDITGDSVTTHIQHKAMLEAKRLLYFTKLSVKEIGYTIGYDDPIHFSKLFKKLTTVTPLQFRSQFRD